MWCSQDSILGPLLFPIILFADDNNIEAIGCSINDVASDLKNIKDWLTKNMLVLNLEKTIQMNIKTDNLNPRFDLNNQYVKVDKTCKYLGVRLHSKLTFNTHISHVVKKLSRQCGIISKFRHYVPRSKLQYKLLQYKFKFNKFCLRILVYGCCSYSSLYPIFRLQKKLKIIHFRKKQDSCNDLFINNTILSVYELHLYALLKFVLRSLNGHHCIKFCNHIFRKQKEGVNTRNITLNLLKIPFKKVREKRFNLEVLFYTISFD